MIDTRRKFIRSVLLFSGTIGMFKSIPVAEACGTTYSGPVYYPISHQLDVSHPPLTDYLDNFYNSELRIEQSSSFIIKTEENPGAPFAAQLDIEIPLQSLKNNYGNVQCSHIDIFSQVMDSIIEGPIYRIASYDFGYNTLPKIGLRYRRDFTYSRLIAVATIIDKTSRNKKRQIYNYTNTLKGGFPCNLTLPEY